MNFKIFSQYLKQLEETPSRLAMTEQLAELFLKLGDDEIPMACYLMQGKLVPRYQSLEFNMSVKMVLRALAQMESQLTSAGGEALDLFGESVAADGDDNIYQKITRKYKKLGDVGLAAEELTKVLEKKGQNQLTLQEVFTRLQDIAKLEGSGSQDQKVTALFSLFTEVDPISSRYISRVVVGKQRLGFSTMTMIDVLSWAVNGDKSESKFLENLYQRKADVGLLAQNYLCLKDITKEERNKKLETQTKITVGIPVVPALCQRLNSAAEIIAKMDEVIVEPKYDGLRVQIHIDKTADGDKKIQVFTRNLENITHMFPELWDGLDALKSERCILDGEAIGYNKETGELLPFQETITRRRKHDVAAKAKDVPLRFYIFDVIFNQDKALVANLLQARKSLLKNLFAENEVFLHAPYVTTKDPEEVRSLHEQYLADKLEGAVIKHVDSQYVSGRKGWNWVKLKEAEGKTGKLNDTLDCVVMGYYFGRGKRADFGIGAILAGVINDDEKADSKDKFSVLTIAKIGTGLSDDQLRDMKERCDKIAVPEMPNKFTVNKNLIPDVWTSPELVVEIAADELTKSPSHSAGLALRFPRLLKIRDDKNADDATTTTELKSIQIA
jgi:DNA ligase 1